jgi:hypothetical protein
VKVVAHQAVAVKFEGLALFQVVQRVEESGIVTVFEKDSLPVVAAINDVVNQAGRNGAKWSRHADNLLRPGRKVNKSF